MKKLFIILSLCASSAFAARSILPSADGVGDLGATNQRWGKIYSYELSSVTTNFVTVSNIVLITTNITTYITNHTYVTNYVGVLDGTNLLDGTVNSNKFDTATKALLGSGSNGGITNGSTVTLYSTNTTPSESELPSLNYVRSLLNNGAVDSVNGYSGVVVLAASDVGAVATDDATYTGTVTLAAGAVQATDATYTDTVARAGSALQDASPWSQYAAEQTVDFGFNAISNFSGIIFVDPLEWIMPSGDWIAKNGNIAAIFGTRKLYDEVGNLIFDWSGTNGPFFPQAAWRIESRDIQDNTITSQQVENATDMAYRNPDGLITNGQTVTLYSTNASPSGSELVSLNYVNSRLNSGVFYYDSTNTIVNGYSATGYVYQATDPAPFNRSYGIASNNQYVREGFTPSLLTNATGPATVTIHARVSGGGNPTVTLRPELYFTADLTNTIYEAVDVSQQTISESTTSNSYQWVFSFPQQTTPVYALSRLKVISFSGTPTLTLYGGSNQVSTLAINSSSSGGDTGGGVTALQVTNIANAAAAQWATNPATAGVYLGTNAMIFVGGGKTNTLTFNGTNFISVITP